VAASARSHGSLQEHYAIEQYGRLSAASSGGAALALTNYDVQVPANEATRQQWADLVGGLWPSTCR
jgi:hypothetical protein